MTAADHAMLALLWSSTVGEASTPADEFEPSAELTEHVSREWEAFRSAAESIGFDPEQHAARPLHPDCEGDWWAAAAHDFELTRNGHGCGFWEPDRWVSPWGQRLTDLAQSFGELTCELDDNGEVFALEAA